MRNEQYWKAKRAWEAADVTRPLLYRHKYKNVPHVSKRRKLTFEQAVVEAATGMSWHEAGRLWCLFDRFNDVRRMWREFRAGGGGVHEAETLAFPLLRYAREIGIKIDWDDLMRRINT